MEDQLVSPAELAEFLGIPVSTICQWRYRGQGPRGYRVGRHVRFRWDDIEHWLASHADEEAMLRGLR